LDVEIKKLPNPRVEADEHYYNPAHSGLIELGLEPNYLTDDVLAKLMETVLRYKENIDNHKIFRNVSWK
jgi:UDP-sulfoquinovose synthase